MNTNLIFKNILDSYQDNTSYTEGDFISILGDSLELLKKIPDHTVALIITDPPYHSTKKKNIKNDTAFSTDEDYIKWMRMFAKEWKRILKYNGSVYCFCASQMNAQLQLMFSEEFNILSDITWTKPNEPGYDGWKQKMKKEALRQWYPHSEHILFMEPSYDGNLFKSYFGNKLREWRKAAGLTMNYLAEVTKSYGKINHGGAISNWEAGRNIPSKDQYNKIIGALLETKQFDELPTFEDMIRPFNVTGDIEFTDIWTFQNVRQYKGKHPAEKPVDLLEHAILSSTYEGDIVLDCFGGSASTAIAAIQNNRKSIIMELEEKWFDYGVDRVRSFYFIK